MAGHLWNEFGIQIMVLLSFVLQVCLLAFGGWRRHSSSEVLRVALWLAYLSADSTAIYALGHLSMASRSSDHLLVAFWAPFLLLHLGGPDNITAYALEDNRLWLRHLQTLIVQALGAAYVIYKYISHDGKLLLAASISMFAAGLAKYGERVWALNSGNISSIADSFDKSDVGEPLRRRLSAGDEGIIDEEEILLRAHYHFDICKVTFTDVTKRHDSSGSATALPESMIADLFKLVEMELSLMYDIVYTKWAVIYTWYGFFIHLISLLGTTAAFVLFQFSIQSSGHWHKYKIVDLVISYVLLGGALVLEAMSLCEVLLSTWACYFLDSTSGWKWLLPVVTSVRRCVRRPAKWLLPVVTSVCPCVRWPANRRLWCGSIEQYNLLHMSVSDKNEKLSWLAKKMGLGDWWNKVCFSTTFSGSEFCSVEDLKVLVLREIATRRGTGDRDNLRGSDALRRNGGDAYFWTVDMDLDKCILVWHLVTDLVIRLPRGDERVNKRVFIQKEKVNRRLVEATKVLSNYMMFLLVVKPDMLPGHTRRSLYLNACKELESGWSDCSKAWGPWKEDVSRSREDDMLANWLLSADLYNNFRKDLPDHPFNNIDIEGRGEEAPEHTKLVYSAIWIFESLRSRAHENVTWLEMIFQVWVEMLMYVAGHCSRDSHARQLSLGGEFITIMWLAVHHLKYYSLP